MSKPRGVRTNARASKGHKSNEDDRMRINVKKIHKFVSLLHKKKEKA